jgi:hypothetical protein
MGEVPAAVSGTRRLTRTFARCLRATAHPKLPLAFDAMLVISPEHLRVYAEGFYTWYAGSRFTYHNLPGVVPTSAAVRINALGLRGDEVPMPKPAGEHRVLVVGDSYTAAVQLPEERIFTTLLQHALTLARPDASYRVVNAA